jgi:GH25 family lysozyme M1 (1,4-beta-N-acetylmuramidase)
MKTKTPSGSKEYKPNQSQFYTRQVSSVDAKGIDVEKLESQENWAMSRRGFLQAAGVTAAGISASCEDLLASASVGKAGGRLPHKY